MRAVLLAAGRGSRLAPLTDDRPKCLVQVGGRPLLDHQVAALAAAGLEEIVVVTGYRADRIRPADARLIHNEAWAETNMVASLHRALDALHGEVLVAYTDLLYGADTVRALRRHPATVGVAVDRDWLRLWRRRMDDPLDDAETLRVDEGGRLREIGGRPESLEEIQGQYVGLIRFSARGSRLLRDTLKEAAARPDDPFGRGRPFARAHLTDLLQHWIARGVRVDAVSLRGGWCEVDTPRDREVAEALLAEGAFDRDREAVS